MAKELVKIRVLAGYGRLAKAGHAAGTVVLVDPKLAADMVAIGHAEYVVDPEKAAPKKKAAPDKPEQRPEPTDEVELR